MLFQLISQGRSFSGHERHCCFLNTGGRRFADISAASGLDFADDGRAVALVDWDLDGDLDVWIANRSGPQLRFLRNDVPSGNHYLAIRLVGRTCNRDAIGARLELTLKGQTTQKQIKTLRAGEGFLAQSSKWIHFGLGSHTEVERLVVHWPGGEAEAFTGLRADRRYLIVQGSDRGETWTAPSRTIKLKPSPLQGRTSTDLAHVFSGSRVPLPRLQYTTLDGESAEVFRLGGGPVLLNLWASWCRPCIAELRVFAEQWHELEAAGLQIVALSVDGLDREEESGPQAAREMTEALHVPFPCGMADAALVEKLQIVHDHLFGWHRQLPVPTSVLIDSSGQLAAIYKGPVEVQQLLTDVDNLPLEGEALRRQSLPLAAGRWFHPYSPRVVAPLVSQLIRQGYADEAIAYLSTNKTRLAREADFPKLLNWLGTELLKRGDPDAAEAPFRDALALLGDDDALHQKLGVALLKQGKLDQALQHFQEAARLKPDLPMALNGMAWILATHPDANARQPNQAIRLAQRACEITKHQKPSILDTLAAAYAASGQFERAVTTAQDAIRLATSARANELVEQIRKRLELYRQARPYQETVGASSTIRP